MYITEIIKGRGSGLRGRRASDFLEKRLKEKGIRGKRYQIAITNDKEIWQKILRVKVPSDMSLAEDAGRSYIAAILVGKAKDINIFKSDLKKEGVIVKGNALVLR